MFKIAAGDPFDNQSKFSDLEAGPGTGGDSSGRLSRPERRARGTGAGLVLAGPANDESARVGESGLLELRALAATYRSRRAEEEPRRDPGWFGGELGARLLPLAGGVQVPLWTVAALAVPLAVATSAATVLGLRSFAPAAMVAVIGSAAQASMPAGPPDPDDPADPADLAVAPATSTAPDHAAALVDVAELPAAAVDEAAAPSVTAEPRGESERAARQPATAPVQGTAAEPAPARASTLTDVGDANDPADDRPHRSGRASAAAEPLHHVPTAHRPDAADSEPANAPAAAAPPAVAAPAADVVAERATCDEVACLVDAASSPCCSKLLHPSAPAPAAQRATAPGRPRLGRPELQAGLDRVRGRIATCGDRHGVSGVVTVQLTVAQDGTVDDLTVGRGSPEFRSCLRDVIGAAQFARADQVTSVAYPLILR
jgi:hypothetical protein